jgi:hypothetical protein
MSDYIDRYPTSEELRAHPEFSASRLIRVRYIPKAGTRPVSFAELRTGVADLDRGMASLEQHLHGDRQATTRLTMSAVGQVLNLAAAKVKANPTLSMSDAQSQVFAENPTLYEKYREETNVPVGGARVVLPRAVPPESE